MEDSRRGISPWLCAALLSLLSLSAFSAAVTFPFAGIDDVDYVTGNPHLQRGPLGARLWWALTTFYFANWHPLTWMSHLLDWEIWGALPSGHHLTSVLLHAANGALLFAFLFRATRLLPPSLLAAALFAVHPLRVESVVWISERKDVLAGFFFFLLLLAWLGYARKPGAARYLLACALLAAGLASKPMLVTAPLVLLIVDRWPLRREEPWSRLLLEKVPLLFLSLCSAALTLRAQAAGRAITPLEEISLGARAANALQGYATYLGKAIWPAGLAVHYPVHAIGAHWLLAAALLLALSALCLWQRRERPQILAGWLWFLVMLLPVIGIVQVGSQAVADRYTYLPLVGPAFALAFSLPWERARLTTLASAAAVAVLFAVTLRQETYWSSTRALFTRALEISPGDPLAEQALANDAFNEGRLDEAEARFRAVLRAWPSSGRAMNSLGVIALRRGDAALALRWLERAMRFEPDPTLVAPGMAAALTRLGRAPEAVRLLERLEPANPDSPSLQRELGVALAAVGREKESEAHLRRAEELAATPASGRPPPR